MLTIMAIRIKIKILKNKRKPFWDILSVLWFLSSGVRYIQVQKPTIIHTIWQAWTSDSFLQALRSSSTQWGDKLRLGLNSKTLESPRADGWHKVEPTAAESPLSLKGPSGVLTRDPACKPHGWWDAGLWAASHAFRGKAHMNLNERN